ncbi:hypothetical protein PCASD_14316 [Puccinia coronata f. sp. avenae]|uniref:Uncharacterized protein n=1 Tax=Puccinia coronata f. sp. avenae TaxID=200324 RepID=A0A2N5U9K2_9BASI|nr:hypothetical protein PCASD_14316 [Puccinia coronata f. sp. avenae]
MHANQFTNSSSLSNPSGCRTMGLDGDWSSRTQGPPPHGTHNIYTGHSSRYPSENLTSHPMNHTAAISQMGLNILHGNHANTFTQRIEKNPAQLRIPHPARNPRQLPAATPDIAPNLGSCICATYIHHTPHNAKWLGVSYQQYEESSFESAPSN